MIHIYLIRYNSKVLINSRVGTTLWINLKKTIDVDVNAFVQVEDSVSSHAKDKYARVFPHISD